MIRRYGASLRLLLAMADASAALMLAVAMTEIRFGRPFDEAWGHTFPWVPTVLLSLGWVTVLWSQGLYRLRAHLTFTSQVLAMVRSVLLMILLTFAGLFLLKLPEVSRLFMILVLPSFALASLALRGAIQVFVSWLRHGGRNTRNVLVVGSGPSAIHYVQEMASHRELGLQVIGYLDGENGEASLGVPFLGGYDQLGQVLCQRVVDEVAVCLDFAEWELMNNVIERCRAEGKIVRIPIAAAFLSGAQTYVEDLSGMPVLSLLDSSDRQLGLAAKRFFDIAAALVGLVVTSPVLIATAAYIWIRDGRPVLFRQTRVGMHGRPFTIYKFRTMVKDAEARYPEVQAMSDTQGAAFKMADDPRITTWGRVLRSTSIDELPQLFNILKGEMSLVGPRPAPPREVDDYDIWHRRRLSMKPGLTGMWQISSRLDRNFDDRAKVDLQYIDRWSLWLDIEIAVRTLPALLRSGGR